MCRKSADYPSCNLAVSEKKSYPDSLLDLLLYVASLMRHAAFAHQMDDAMIAHANALAVRGRISCKFSEATLACSPSFFNASLWPCFDYQPVRIKRVRTTEFAASVSASARFRSCKTAFQPKYRVILGACTTRGPFPLAALFLTFDDVLA